MKNEELAGESCSTVEEGSENVVAYKSFGLAVRIVKLCRFCAKAGKNLC
jgi:hypothetical protein